MATLFMNSLDFNKYNLTSIECWNNCIVCEKDYNVEKSLYNKEGICSVECQNLYKFKKMDKLSLSLNILKKELDIIIEGMSETEYDADYEFDYTDDEKYTDEYYESDSRKNKGDVINKYKMIDLYEDHIDDRISKTYKKFVKGNYSCNSNYDNKMLQKKQENDEIDKIYNSINNPEHDIRWEEVGMSRGVSGWYDDDEDI